jgi:hypothetical protein
MEFAEFIFELARNKEAVVIEIHPPFNNYSSIDTFLSNYEIFENIIFNRWPDVNILLENRSGTTYSGGRFLISRIKDLKEFVNKINKTSFRLNIALDIPQLFTAHGGHQKFNSNDIVILFSSLSPMMHRVRSIHLWGKKLINERWVAHVGDLNDFFNDDQSKKRVFLSNLAKLLNDGRKRYFVPEVNSSDKDLQNIVTDLEGSGINFEVS